jgi:hypothetical protein
MVSGSYFSYLKNLELSVGIPAERALISDYRFMVKNGYDCGKIGRRMVQFPAKNGRGVSSH